MVVHHQKVIESQDSLSDTGKFEILLNAVGGECRTRVIRLDKEAKTVDEILSSCKTAYTSTLSGYDHLQWLYNCKQLQNETISDFADRLEHLNFNLGNCEGSVKYDPEETLRSTFVRGLSDDRVKLGIGHLIDDKKKSYSDLRNKATQLEADYAEKKHKVHNVDIETSQLCNALELLTNKVTQLEAKLEEKPRARNQYNSTSIECYFCRRKGHIKANCYKYKDWLTKKGAEGNNTGGQDQLNMVHIGDKTTSPMNHLKHRLTGPKCVTSAKINNIVIDCVIDTGAVTSVISERFVKTNKLDVRPMADFGPGANCNFITANGDKLAYDGYVSVVLSLDGITEPIDAIFLVMETSDHDDYVLLGTNVLQFLYDYKDTRKQCNSTLHSAIDLVHSVMHRHNIVKAPGYKCKLPSNSVSTRVAKLKVKSVSFVRQILLVPTKQALDIPGLSFKHSCINIPKHEEEIKIPFTVENSTRVDRFLPKHLPLYTIENVNDVIELNEPDQALEVMSDEELLSRCKIDLEKFSEEQQAKVLEILVEHKSVFAANDYQLGELRDYEYHINIKQENPQKIRYRPINPKLYDQVQKQLKVLLNIGVIQETKSEYSSPAVLVPKQNSNEIRIAIDYRHINNHVISAETKVMPRIEHMISLLGGNEYFSSCDVQSGFLQIKLDEQSRKYTAFTVGSGKNMEYTRLPFGLKVSSSCFQKCMENVLGDLLYKHAVVYIDDFLLLGKTFDDHCTSLDRVLNRIKHSGLKLKPEKCSLFKEKLVYLGYEISSEGIRSDPSKLEVIRNWQIPTSTTDLKKFLGVLGYFRKSMDAFAQHAAPLTSLLKGKLVRKGKHRKFKYVDFVWGEEHTNAFNKLKEIFLENVCLAYPDYNKEFMLFTDASLKGIGSVLTQKINNRIRPIAFASRKLTKSEMAYSVHHLELLALMWSVTNKFADYLRHNHCTVYTDNSPLTYILDKVEIDPCTQRWCSKLANFSLSIRYGKGKNNIVADTMSRLHTNHESNTDCIKKWCEKVDGSKAFTATIEKDAVNQIFQGQGLPFPVLEQSVIASIQNDDIENTEVMEDDIVDKINITFKKSERIDWYTLQRTDNNIQYAINNFVDKYCNYSKIKDQSPEVKALFKFRKVLSIENGLLYKVRKSHYSGKQLIINESCVELLKEAYHDAQGHLGMDRVLKAVQDRYYCYKLAHLMRDALNKCIVCLARKTLHASNRTVAYERPIACRPMQNLAIDHLTIDSSSGKTMKVLTVTDEMSKMLFIIPVRNEKAKSTADALCKLFLTYGMPVQIHSDNGKSFVNKVVAELLKSFDIKHTTLIAYNSRSNAICERQNSVILNMLGCLTPTQKNKWWKYCDVLAYAYNTMECTTGYSPFYVFHGRHPRLIGDVILGLEFQYQSKSVPAIIETLHKVYESCVANLVKTRGKYRETYNNKIPKVICDLDVGDICLVRNERMQNKIDNRWSPETYEITEKLDENMPVYKLKHTNSDRVIKKHRNQLILLFKGREIVKPKYQHKLRAENKSRDQDSKQGEHSSDEYSKDTDSDGYSSDDTGVKFQCDKHDTIVHDDIPEGSVRTRSGRLSVRPNRLGIDELCTRL